MKNKLIIVVIALLILAAVSYFYSKSDKVEAKDSDQAQAVLKEEIKGGGLYTFDPASSKITWEGRKTFAKGWIDVGTISIQSGDINVADGKISEGKITIDMNTIAANKTGAGKGEDMLSKHLKSAEFFDVTVFPTSQFNLTSITKVDGEFSYQVKGDITIKGITKPVEFPADVYLKDGAIALLGRLVIDRSQFDVKYGSVTFFKDIGDNAVDNDFVLNLDLIAKK